MKKLFAAILVAALAGCVGMGGPFRFENGLLANSGGMTLYTFDRDAAGNGKSACNGPCAVNWPPVMAAASDAASGDWSVITRDDGTKQWAYKGKPVYLWIKDQKPGDTTGDGVNKVWHVVRQ